MNSAILVSTAMKGVVVRPHTRRAVRVVARECHLGLEESAIVDRVRVDDHEGDMPFEDVLVDELDVRELASYLVLHYRGRATYLDVGPRFLGEGLELGH